MKNSLKKSFLQISFTNLKVYFGVTFCVDFKNMLSFYFCLLVFEIWRNVKLWLKISGFGFFPNKKPTSYSWSARWDLPESLFVFYLSLSIQFLKKLRKSYWPLNSLLFLNPILMGKIKISTATNVIFLFSRLRSFIWYHLLGY